MIDVVRFTDGTYGLINNLNGQLLTHKDGTILQFRNSKKAWKYADKLLKALNKTINEIGRI